MRLEPAGPSDLATVAALMNRAYRGGAGWTTEAGYIVGERTSADRLARDLVETPAGRLLLARDPDGAIVGCVWLQPAEDDAWYLGSLTIDPARQAAGLGHRLLVSAEEAIRGAGGGRVRMTVIHLRDTLIAWYARRGYRPTGETQPFPYAGSPFGTPLRDDLHFVVLEKALGSRA